MSDTQHRVLEAQLQECFARVVYTHKTHEKQADLLDGRRRHLNLLQIVLSAIGTGGYAASLLGEGPLGAAVGSLVSLGLLVLNSYTKDHDLGAIAQRHKQSASELWLVREKYSSLLADLRMGGEKLEDARSRREQLMIELHEVQQSAPITTAKAYVLAQKALQKQGDFTFSQEEIDSFLPTGLKNTGAVGLQI